MVIAGSLALMAPSLMLMRLTLAFWRNAVNFTDHRSRPRWSVSNIVNKKSTKRLIPVTWLSRLPRSLRHHNSHKLSYCLYISMSERLPPKQRTKVPRQQMPEREPQVRARDFGEVNMGFSAALAEKEAQRCLACADPKCVHGCPVGVKVREVVDLVVEGDYS